MRLNSTQQVITGALTPLSHAKISTKPVEFGKTTPIMHGNNTPPASHWNSAPRGVTRFWGTQTACNGQQECEA